MPGSSNVFIIDFIVWRNGSPVPAASRAAHEGGSFHVSPLSRASPLTENRPMIDLICPKCETKLPVAESKIGTRIFVCPQCLHPLEGPAVAAGPAVTAPVTPKPAPAETSED